MTSLKNAFSCAFLSALWLAGPGSAAILLQEDWSTYTDGVTLNGASVSTGSGLSGSWTVSGASAGVLAQNGAGDDLAYTWDDPGPTTFTSNYASPGNAYQSPVLSAGIDSLVGGGAITGKDVYFSFLMNAPRTDTSDAGVWMEFGSLDFGVHTIDGTTAELLAGSAVLGGVPFSQATTYRITGELLWDGSEYTEASVWLNQSYNHPTPAPLAQLLNVDISAENLTSLSSLQFRFADPRVGSTTSSTRLGEVILGETLEDVSSTIPEPSSISLLLGASLFLRRTLRRANKR